MTLAPGKAAKHFTAYYPVAKWTVAGVAALAAGFLDKVLAEMSFPITGIQVDGVSELIANFEQACRDNGLELFMLPPKRPQLNGAVGAATAPSATSSTPFTTCRTRSTGYNPSSTLSYIDTTITGPHDALDGQTPAEYLSSFSSGTATVPYLLNPDTRLTLS